MPKWTVGTPVPTKSKVKPQKNSVAVIFSQLRFLCYGTSSYVKLFSFVLMMMVMMVVMPCVLVMFDVAMLLVAMLALAFQLQRHVSDAVLR